MPTVCHRHPSLPTVTSEVTVGVVASRKMFPRSEPGAPSGQGEALIADRILAGMFAGKKGDVFS